MRLIDADELKKDIMSYKTMPEIRKVICEVIDDAPTIDLDERDNDAFETGYIKGLCENRPQGEWISDWRDDLDAMSRRGWKCSCCSWRTSYGTPRFCMNCGADMREDSDK